MTKTRKRPKRKIVKKVAKAVKDILKSQKAALNLDASSIRVTYSSGPGKTSDNFQFGPFLCPKCDGEREVAEQPKVAWSTGDAELPTRKCPTCKGIGVLWRPQTGWARAE